jgi:Reverse transcriptase (RNA-dependent DNA polymerase)
MYLSDTLPELRADKRAVDGAAADSSYIIQSQLGVQQGDPLGPLLYALAQTHALHPVANSSSASGSSSSGEDVDSDSSSSSDVIAPHSGYLDDLNALLSMHIDEAVVRQVRTIIQRLASVGLEINSRKSLFVAKRGYTFTTVERALISSLDIPYVDASKAAEECGFVTVGCGSLLSSSRHGGESPFGGWVRLPD